MVEELLAAPSIDVTYETVRQWVLQFGQKAAKRIRAGISTLGDKWHRDEVVITIKGKRHWLWREVDQHGYVLGVLVQSRRNTQAGERLMRKLLRKHGKTPRVMVTDKLKS
jgi:putative transposase